ncbi:hypothetical protein [Mycoplasmopsis cricetuli]|uniref:hypothetical protein n=1 Tax=Mycoplasmopsis cricetuli TaxID=171283 RepID=UPI00046EC2A2|nr:hypothetical protein [Mycoplasmopsis cricetuli]
MKLKNNSQFLKINNNNNNFKILIYLSFYLCLIIIGTFSNLTLIPIGIASINITSIIIVFAAAHIGFLGSLFSGLFLGICSLINALIKGRVLFIYPLISIFPRFLVGICFFVVLYLIEEKIIKKNVNIKNIKSKWLIFASYFFLGCFIALINTLFVTSGVFLHKSIFGLKEVKIAVSFKFWITSIYFNAIFEFLAMGMLTSFLAPFLVYLWKKRKKQIYSIYW